MKVDKFSVAFDPDHGDAVRAAVRDSGGVSRWMADARRPSSAPTRAGGVLLGVAGARDAVDASVAVSGTGDRIVTSGPDDIGPLVAAAGRSIHIVAC